MKHTKEAFLKNLDTLVEVAAGKFEMAVDYVREDADVAMDYGMEGLAILEVLVAIEQDLNDAADVAPPPTEDATEEP